MNYEVELSQPNLKSYKIITVFMAILNAVSFIFYFLNTQTSFLKSISLLGIFSSASLLLILFIKMKTWRNAFKGIAVLFTFIAICWLFAANYYFLFLFSLLALFSFISLKAPVISITDEGIKYPSFPIKFYNWQQVNQVLIKDDVLSLDLSDNKFLQFLLPASIISKIDIPVFNESCKQEIIKSSAEEIKINITQ